MKKVYHTKNSQKRPHFYVVLCDIRSALNVGSIFRTADGAGAKKVFLVGYTPAPLDRFGRVRTDIAKTALGAERSLPWERVKDFDTLRRELAREDISFVAVEQDRRAKNYKDFLLERPTAFVLGNETEGLPEALLDVCDEILEIPLSGKKESLNVSVAAAVVLFHARDALSAPRFLRRFKRERTAKEVPGSPLSRS